MGTHPKYTVLECYSVRRNAPPQSSERLEYIPQRFLSDDTERFFDSSLDEALANLVAERVLIALEKGKEAEVARSRFEYLISK